MAKRKRSKAYINRIMKEGTPKERAMLVANSYSERVFGNKGFLTREQIGVLAQGVKAQTGLKTYKQILDDEYHIRIMIPFLKNIELELSERVSFANGLCMTDYTTNQFIDLLNNLCNDQGEAFRDKVISNMQNKGFLTGKIYASKEYPFLDFKKMESINEVVESLKEQIIFWMTDLKTMINAIRDFMKEQKLKIDAYEEYLNSKEEKWKQDPSIIPMYGFEYLEYHSMTDEIREYMEQFQIFPDYKQITIDKGLYKSYKCSLGGIDYEGPE
jgi:hypothetical protein